MVNTQTKERLLTAKEVGEMLSVSKRQIFRLRSRRAIPAPIKIGAGAIRWRISDILLFLQYEADMSKFRARKATEK